MSLPTKTGVDSWPVMDAQQLWLLGRKQEAIDSVLRVLNQAGNDKPVRTVLQLAYYIYLCGDPGAAAQFLETTRARHPHHPELLLNLAVCLSRSGQHESAVLRAREVLTLNPQVAIAYDTLASSLHKLGKFEDASVAGSNALSLKAAATKPISAVWKLPDGGPRNWLCSRSGMSVISFSLWGRNPRYLRGALDNLLAITRFYPGWIARFYVDETVPTELLSVLLRLGADIQMQTAGSRLRERLCWRFRVANDPEVGRFLVRDVDSVVNARERDAVKAWEESDSWFHVMRDWWTHTDLILAGLWGGIAGVLPHLDDLLLAYQPSVAETPNVDQWFLRDEVWPLVRNSCMVHDRCFRPTGAHPWPSPAPAGNEHVGQDEYSARKEQQSIRLTEWIKQLECLS